jgi:hypothetical protein
MPLKKLHDENESWGVGGHLFCQCHVLVATTFAWCNEEKPYIYKSKMKTHPSKYKANETMSRPNPREKKKKSIKNKEKKTLCKYDPRLRNDNQR